METAAIDANALLGYQLRLPSFEGPFDVLLRLIERSQFSITDISLVAVTDQFLEYVQGLGSAPSALIAEFANVGARLVLSKSRTLLPRPPAIDEDESSSDLARELIEYRAVKQAAMALRQIDLTGLGGFARASSAVTAPGMIEMPKLAHHEPQSLVKAIRRRLLSLAAPQQLLVSRPIVTLREMIERVMHALDREPKLRFRSIAETCSDTSEVRTAFLGLLVLIRRGLADAEQSETFGEIRISRSRSSVFEHIGLTSAMSMGADD